MATVLFPAKRPIGITRHYSSRMMTERADSERLMVSATANGQIQIGVRCNCAVAARHHE
jgi:hypothetical protein